MNENLMRTIGAILSVLFIVGIGLYLTLQNPDFIIPKDCSVICNNHSYQDSIGYDESITGSCLCKNWTQPRITKEVKTNGG